MVYNFTINARILGVKAWRFGLYFVLLDIAFVLLVSFPNLGLTFLKSLPRSSSGGQYGLRQ